MKLYPSQIVRLADSTYQVSINTTDPVSTRDFLFKVEGDIIRFVVWEDDFAEFMRRDVGTAMHLLAAIKSMDRAQGIDLL